MPKPIEQWTEQEIDALTEGRETDALVALRIMGLAIVTPNPENSAIHGGSRVCYGIYLDTGERHKWGPVVKDIPRYSGDIGAAWLVVEKMQSNGFCFDADGDAKEKRFRFGVGQGIGAAKTAQLAICKAALKAVRAQRLREVTK